MKRTTRKSSSKSSSKKVKIRYNFDINNDSILKLKWQSPNDKKMNVIDFTTDPEKGNTIKIKDNH
jgi:hypothetical protein